MGEKFYENKKNKFLYHFTTFKSAKSILDSGSLHFGNFRKSNDIFEVSREIISKVSEKEISKEINRYKFLSFSINDSSFVFEKNSLWGYYANKGKGICLVFDKEKLCNSFKKINGIKRLGKIKYRKDYCPTIFNYSLDNKNEIIPYVRKNYKEIFFVKSLDWKLESEYRLIINSEDKKAHLNIKDLLVGVIISLPQSENYQESKYYLDLSTCIEKSKLYIYTTKDGEKCLLNEGKRVFPEGPAPKRKVHLPI